MSAPEEPTPASPEVEAKSAPSPMQRTARQLSRRTTDLLAMAIVAVGVLTISGRLSNWWSTDPSDVMSPLESATNVAGQQLNWGSGDSAVRMIAGDFPVELERRIIRGTQDEADEFLLNRCQQVLEGHTGQSTRITESLRPTEQKLVERLAELEPIRSSAGEWALYRVDQPGTYLPGSMLVGVTISDGEQSVACWTIAIPHDKEQWTTFVFTPSSGSTPSSAVPMPASAEAVLSLQTPAGDELSVFRSREGESVNDRAWRRTIEAGLVQAGWQTVRPWRQSGETWSLRVEGELDSTPPSPAAIELTLKTTLDGRLSCVVNVIRKQSKAAIP